MALYAFDGTWNSDSDKDGLDTNVVKFKELYDGVTEYIEGVGTRHGRIGQVMGGLFGAGGRSRVSEMCDALIKNWEQDDQVVDVIGFSRGAALAVHFTNKINQDGLVLSSGEKIFPKVRFLGLWDLVGSFGLSFDTFIDFQSINLGWDIDYITNNVGKCCHAMALDERRETFNVTRLDPNNVLDSVDERWFRGVHSDVGGGNDNPDRSNIALQWMLRNAEQSGLPINSEKANDAKYAKTDDKAKISENKDVQIDQRRTVNKMDSIDPSAKAKVLGIHESLQCTVFAALKFNWSGVYLEKGAKYKFSVAQEGVWFDNCTDGTDGIKCGASGWTSEQLPWINEKIVDLMEPYRRHPRANWFELIGAYGDEDDHLIRLGDAENDQTIQSAMDGELYFFANDLKSDYADNKGSLEVTITRIS